MQYRKRQKASSYHSYHFTSPLKDDGYDISDYNAIHPSYGTMQDFNRFINEAHRRGLKVITELVINHTSDQHPWFLRAGRAPKGSAERDYYVWSETADIFWKRLSMSWAMN